MREDHTGWEDKLEPLESLDIRATERVSDLLSQMSKTAFGARELGDAYSVLQKIASDPYCLTVVTLSGAMTVAKMGLVLCEMINMGLADIIVSTGALIVHGLCESTGGTHFKHSSRLPDETLYQWGYNRIYDTLELEANFGETELFLEDLFAEAANSPSTCSATLTKAIGRKLVRSNRMPGILGAAYLREVPVYIPAFTDSELGLMFSRYQVLRARSGGNGDDLNQLLSGFRPNFNPFLDLHDYVQRIVRAKTLAIFTIGGGVPRNWAQQAAPFVQTFSEELDFKVQVPRFRYGVRICPEPVHWGGLSGCSYSEGISWGKFVSPEEGGAFAEVHCDATIAWPLLIRAALEFKQAK